MTTFGAQLHGQWNNMATCLKRMRICPWSAIRLADYPPWRISADISARRISAADLADICQWIGYPPTRRISAGIIAHYCHYFLSSGFKLRSHVAYAMVGTHTKLAVYKASLCSYWLSKQNRLFYEGGMITLLSCTERNYTSVALHQ